MDPTALAGSIASHGLLGVMLVVMSYVAWSKDKELQDEKQARIDDAKSYNELALKLQADAIGTINKVGDIFEEMKKIMTPTQGRPFGGGR